jgi:[acyl-carrier-protein] S-malonyltransferase
MGKALAQAYPVAKKTILEADEILGFAISQMIFEGPEDQLRLTYNTQPAIMAVSVAAWRTFQESFALTPAFVAGHSLGEYTALVAAGAIAYEDALRLVYKRGRLMDEAVPDGAGAMAVVLGADVDLLTKLCETISQETGYAVEMANINCPGQVTVSGATSAVEELIKRVPEAKARRAVMLDVSGPFHSSLMAPAADQLSQALSVPAWNPPQMPLMANVSAQMLTTEDSVRAALRAQLAAPVLWERSIKNMVALGVDVFVEFGPGTVLSGLIRKTDKSVKTLHVEDPETLVETVQFFQ